MLLLARLMTGCNYHSSVCYATISMLTSWFDVAGMSYGGAVFVTFLGKWFWCSQSYIYVLCRQNYRASKTFKMINRKYRSHDPNDLDFNVYSSFFQLFVLA